MWMPTASSRCRAARGSCCNRDAKRPNTTPNSRAMNKRIRGTSRAGKEILGGLNTATYRVQSHQSGWYRFFDFPRGIGECRRIYRRPPQRRRGVRVRVPLYGCLAADRSDPGEPTLFFVFTRATNDNQSLFNVNWIDFHGPGLQTVPSTSVVRAAEQPQPFTLHPAYPNPSNGSVVFAFRYPIRCTCV